MKNEPYYKLNKYIMKNLSAESACIYGVMLDFCEYAKREGQLTKDGYFYLTTPTLEDITGFKRKRQDKAIKLLEGAGFIRSKKQGMPAKRFFQLVPKRQTRVSERDKQECPKGTNKSVPKGQTRVSERDKHVSPYGTTTKNITKEHNQRTYNQEEAPKPIDKNHPIIILYRDNWGLPNTVVYSDIKEAMKVYGDEWVEEAIKEALRNNAKGWGYINRILNRWGLQYPKDSKPWELEKGGNNGKYRNNSKKVYGNASAEDWENEPAGLEL